MPKMISWTLFNFLLIIIGLGHQPQSWGQTSIADSQLVELIRTGLKNSFGILKQKIDDQNSQLDYISAKTAFLPTLTLNAGRSWSRPETISNGERSSKSEWSNNLTVSANWTLYSNGQNITNLRAASLDRQVQKIKAQQALAEYIQKVITAYYDYLLLVDKKKILDNRYQQAKWANQKAQELVSIGAKTKIDAFDTEIELANVEKEMLEAKGERAKELQKLQFIVNPTEEVKIEEVSLQQDPPYYMKRFSENWPKIRKKRIQDVHNAHYEILSDKLNLKKKRIEYRQKKRERLPTVNLSLQHSINANGLVNSVQTSDEEHLIHNTGGTLALTWPIFSWFGQEREITKSANEVLKEEYQFKEKSFEKSSEFLGLISQYQVLLESLKSAKLILKKGSIQYQYSKEMYVLGKITIYELNQANTRLTSAVNDLASKLKQQYTLASKILFALGDPLVPPGTL